jgi:hypothetical protein
MEKGGEERQLGNTHFVKDYFVKKWICQKPNDDQKIIEQSLCQKYL